MRMMMKAMFPVEAGNKAIKDGSLEKMFQQVSDQLRPECSYFFSHNGKRAAMFVFDMEDTSMIPMLAEPMFMSCNAEVEFFPVMNHEDLKRGLQQAGKNMGKMAVGAGNRH